MNEQLPLALLDSLSGIESFDRVAFEKTHASGEQLTSIRINPMKSPVINSEFNFEFPVPWTRYGYYLPSRPSFTFDPLFHAGTYYVQEASSMFLEQALTQLVDLSQPLKVLDLCAAPGGKSTHIQSLLSKESLLVSNEVIRQRAGILKDNIIKWGTTNTVVTNNDPAHFTKLENYFDVIVIDAPCSGSGLFRRDAEAMDEWSENNVQLCWQRQQRILADTWPALKENGILIYSTCSYSMEEDEDIMTWLLKQVKAEACTLNIDPSWGIVQVGNEQAGIGYRFWPDKVKGEGLFMACCRKKEGDEAPVIRVKNKPPGLTKKEMGFVEQWIEPEGISFIKHENTVYAWPSALAGDMSFLLEQLRVIYSGVLAGQLVHDKLVPDHALAMSPLTIEKIIKTELDNEQAIKYLQRKEFMIEGAGKGWQLVTYRGYPLGWINVLQNRLNNYYPKEMRILKDN